jgi:glyoxylase-like metal-dependent hydrolase (beta-lactamase superfamily II)
VSEWSIWMLEYAHCLDHPVGAIRYGAWNEGTTYLAYSYVYLEGEGHKVLVDTGYDGESSNARYAADSNVQAWTPPADVLARVGVRPEEIDTIILTHAHYDHMGGLRFFPNAHVYIQGRELEKQRELIAMGPKFAALTSPLDPNDVAYAETLVGDRLTLLDGRCDELLPGISVHSAFDTHSEGSQYVSIDAGAESWVVTGDNLFNWSNGEAPYTPIGFGSGGARRNLEVIDEMLGLAGSLERCIVMHEPRIFAHFPSACSSEGLSVAEIQLAPGVASRVGTSSERREHTIASPASVSKHEADH